MILRNDDISPSTDFEAVKSIYKQFRKQYPDCEIWSCVSLFGKKNLNGAVYPDLPLRSHDLKYFFDVDSVIGWLPTGLETIVSHGLIHCDHAKLSKDAQEFSILMSCSFLKTKIFVPPFSSYNAETERICQANGIALARPDDGWKSLESDTFDDTHKLWFFHSWRYTKESAKKLLQQGSIR